MSILGSCSDEESGSASAGRWAQAVVFLQMLLRNHGMSWASLMGMILEEVPCHLTNQSPPLRQRAELAYSVLMLQPRGAEVLGERLARQRRRTSCQVGQ